MVTMCGYGVDAIGEGIQSVGEMRWYTQRGCGIMSTRLGLCGVGMGMGMGMADMGMGVGMEMAFGCFENVLQHSIVDVNAI